MSEEAAARILVVDDDKTFCQALSLALKRRGYQVLLAHDVEEGLREARAFLPDRVVVDLRMPGRSGLELVKARSQGPRRPARPDHANAAALRPP
jgi:two-component system response regulator RegA